MDDDVKARASACKPSPSRKVLLRGASCAFSE